MPTTSNKPKSAKGSAKESTKDSKKAAEKKSPKKSAKTSPASTKSTAAKTNSTSAKNAASKSVAAPTKTSKSSKSKTSAKKSTPKAEIASRSKTDSKSAPEASHTSSAISGGTPRAKSNSNSLTLALAGIACALGIAGFGLSLYNFLGGHINVNFGFDGNSANFTEGSIAEIANNVAPSVVSIITETRTNGWYGQSSTSTAAGTGMIITADGYVLTNKHVVEGANSLEVVLDDGTSYSNVSVIGTDPLNDAAIIKIKDVDNLKPVTLGNSKTLSIGQQVIAIGNALGQYQNSVTEGIISGVGRNITATDSSSSYSENLSDMIQTDAQINSGNSGGPLVNAAGEVIGINTALSSSGNYGNSISFAIPISSVKGIINSVIKTGKLERAYIGVAYVPVTPTIAKTYNLPVSNGAYLASSDAIIPGGPAEKAGLKSGDIITKVNGVEIGKNGSLSTLIGEYTVGDTVDLTVLRDGKEMNVRLTLEAYSTPSQLNTVRQ